MSAALADLASLVRSDPDAVLAEHARRSLLAFCRRLFPGYQTPGHVRTIADRLEAVERGGVRRLVVTMPPRHGKSELASSHFPAWFLGRNPDKRVIGCAHTAGLAYRFSRQARSKVRHPAWPFPVETAADLAAVQSWDLSGHRGGYVAAGVGGPITGYGADLLLVDDPVKSAEEADSETYRERAWEWWTGTAATRLEPGGAAVVIGTRWHHDDLIGRLVRHWQENGEPYELLHLPALDDDGNALWPERFPAAALASIRKEVGGRNWEAQYQGRPVPAAGGMFKRDWWRRYRALPAVTRAEIAVDSAFKDGVGNDYSAFALWATDGAGSAYLVRAWRERLEFPALIQYGHSVHAWARRRLPNLRIPLVVEDKASGQSAIQVWSKPYHTRDGMLPALPVVPFPAEANKAARAEGVTPDVEGGRAFVPEDGEADWDLDGWLTEHEQFPHAKHDDRVDTTSIALVRLLNHGPDRVVRRWRGR